MQVDNKCILLLKAEKSDDSNDKYEAIIKQNGFRVKHLKTLDFKYRNLQELRKRLEQPSNYSGIVFTTPRTMQAVKHAISNDFNILAQWTDKANYVVGETTHSLVLNELKLNCSGQETGNAKNLAELILKNKGNINERLLLPCGTLKTDILASRLNEEGVAVECVTVYETVPSDHLDQDFYSTTSDFKQIPEYWVYFSPSGVNNTTEHIEKVSKISHLLKFVAIGPTTEQALRERNIPVCSVALKPTPDELLKAILNS